MKKILLALLILFMCVIEVVMAFLMVVMIAIPITFVLRAVLILLVVFLTGSFKFMGIASLLLIFVCMLCGILLINFIARASFSIITPITPDKTPDWLKKMQKWVGFFQSDEFLTISSISLGLLTLAFVDYGQLSFQSFIYEEARYISFSLGLFITAYLINRGVLKKLRNLMK